MFRVGSMHTETYRAILFFFFQIEEDLKRSAINQGQSLVLVGWEYAIGRECIPRRMNWQGTSRLRKGPTHKPTSRYLVSPCYDRPTPKAAPSVFFSISFTTLLYPPPHKAYSISTSNNVTFIDHNKHDTSEMLPQMTHRGPGMMQSAQNKTQAYWFLQCLYL